MARELPALLSSLRTHTGELHRSLESTPCMVRLGAPDVTPHELATALTVLHTGFTAIEAQLADEPWYRPQAPALAADLSLLPPAPAPPPIAPPPLTTHAARLGAAYVLVGSRLGARTIARNLRGSMGDDFVTRSQYYGAEADHAGEQWQTLIQQIPTSDDEQQTTTAAVATFRLLMDLSTAASAPLSQ